MGQAADGGRPRADGSVQTVSAESAGSVLPGDARRFLLAGLVDYAGLFPPAALPMADVVQRYDEYRRGAHAWALGKFVVPVARLADFEGVARPRFGHGDAWEVAVIAGPDFGADVRVIAEFAARIAPRAAIAAVEVKGATTGEIDAIARSAALLRANVEDEFDVYVEVPIAADPSALIASIASHGLRAKVRTGGVEAGAFPTAGQLAAFFAACTAHGVAFKATAGLHHAMRGNYPFTYDPASEHGTMFGFLNVFLAAVFERDGLGESETRALLEERDPASFTFGPFGVSWRGHRVSPDSLRRMRAQAATSFGSCSFAEPVDDLSSLGLL
jgi:hypothetical protein